MRIRKTSASHCSRHFVSGSPAKSFEKYAVDWIPIGYLEKILEESLEKFLKGKFCRNPFKYPLNFRPGGLPVQIFRRNSGGIS